MSLGTVEGISNRHAAAMKAPVEVDSPDSPALFKSSDSERDQGFQRLMGFLRQNAEDSMQDTREKKEGFTYMEALLSHQSEEYTVIRHPQVATSAAALGTGVAAAQQVKPDLNKQLNAVLQTTGPVAKPLDNTDKNKFAANAEGLKNAADKKSDAMTAKIDTIKQDAKAITSKMDGAQMQTAMADNRAPSGAGGMAAELGLSAAGHPAVGAASAAINAQGQGTHSTQKTASAPVLSAKEQKKAPYVMSYGEPAPQPIAAPSGPTNVADMNKQMGKGPGFGDLDARSKLTGLTDVRMTNVDRMIENSPAMKAATSQLGNAQDVKFALNGMKENGMVDGQGKQQLNDKDQEFVKAPPAPMPASFRV